MQVDIDTSQVTALAAELSGVGARAVPQVRLAVQETAGRVQRGMRSDARRSVHFGQIARTITSDVRGLMAEIGPTHGGAGSLANIYYFGTSRGGGSGDLTGALGREAPAFEAALAAAAAGAVLGSR